MQNNMFVECEIYDVAGKLVKNIYKGYWTKDDFKVIWNAKDSKGNAVGPGVYFVRLKTPISQDCIKLVITE